MKISVSPRRKVFQITSWSCHIVLTTTFAAAGLLKLVSLPETQQDIASYQILPEIFLWPFALLLPWTEIASAAAILLPKTRPTSCLLFAIMLIC
ncbi:MAG: DoxX family membrane protein [Puniceicoccales bacterium]|nr:DoxX family membrane protein [Puniceicoccales bacterium]